MDGWQLAGFIGLWLIPMYHCFRIKKDSVRVTVFLVVSVEVNYLKTLNLETESRNFILLI